MEYLKDAWYAAAWSHELQPGKLLARTLLEQPVVLYRDDDGHANALFDRCPHRFAPLSLGKLIGSSLQCAYHGLRFDRSGICVHNPYDPARIPARAHVRKYAVLERQGIAWIWMGDAAVADESAAPDFPVFDDTARWHAIRGYLVLPGNYLLGIDNLMDLTHPEYIHDGSLGSPALKTAHYMVTQDGPRVVNSKRWFESGPIPPLLGHSFPTEGRPVEHWVDMQWHAASSLWLHSGATFPGRPRSEGLNAYTAHLLTPETKRTAHYFFSLVRSAEEARAQNNDEALLSVLTRIFTDEDSPIIKAIQQRMGDDDLWSLKPASLPGDAGGLAVRKALDALLALQSKANIANTLGDVR